ncbi:MAG TPA: hypothetical protein VIL68_05850 [Propionibacteriaceae bacterium]
MPVPLAPVNRPPNVPAPASAAHYRELAAALAADPTWQPVELLAIVARLAETAER